jgi:hypothetical protein
VTLRAHLLPQLLPPANPIKVNILEVCVVCEVHS